MSGPDTGRAALEAQEKELVDEVAGLVRREQALDQEKGQVVNARVQAVGGLIAIRKALGKPPEGDAPNAPEAATPPATRPNRATRRAKPRPKGKTTGKTTAKKTPAKSRRKK